MPKKKDIKKIMVIGSGPIVIGQAAEFDYAGTQACLALKELGYQVVLVNSNPATIMTDTNMADKVYLEPLDLEHVARIVRTERPCGLICCLGGQTGLNLGIQLYKKGILEECGVKVLGTSIESIEIAEDRKLFKEFCERIEIPTIKSAIATTEDEAIAAAKNVGFPVVLRPAFTLGGTGGGFAYSEEEVIMVARNALKLSPVSQVLVEKSIKGFKEVEFEVVRDAKDNVVIIAGMENIDPVGVHTGDSIVVCPTQTINDKDLQMLKKASADIVRNLDLQGGCNVQLAISPNSSEYYIIEINPRLSRSSALASKATAYPIAKVATNIACGLSLDEIKIAKGFASVEPIVDYVVAKFPRFPFDKFPNADRTLNTQMKATGEVMSIGSNIEEVLLKAVRSMEIGLSHLYMPRIEKYTKAQLLELIKKETDERIWAIAHAMRIGVSVDELFKVTAITPFFLEKIKNIVDMELNLKEDKESVLKAKVLGFSDEYIGKILGKSAVEIFNFRKKNKIIPSFKMINTSGIADDFIPYFYSSYTGACESKPSKNKKVIVLGSGPVRIGQGIEFDYSTVHSVWAIQQMGYEAIVINNNPETVSTDYKLSNKLYFEPLTFEDVMNIVDHEAPMGVICALGGQTAINLADDLEKAGVNIIGTSNKSIKTAEDRDLFTEAMNNLGIPVPSGKGVFTIDEAIKTAKEIGYPVLVRPSFVLGGHMMHVVNDEVTLRKHIKNAIDSNPKHPVLVDKYIVGKECEVDAIADGKNVFIPGIMEHIERAGVHSGDSTSVYPTINVDAEIQQQIVEYTTKIGLGLNILGPYNIQYIIEKETKKLYVIEVNPRSSRTVPFIAKSTNTPVANIATKVMLGESLEKLRYVGLYPAKSRWYVKTPTFSFSKIVGSGSVLSPEMKSTGEAIGYDDTLCRAIFKSFKAAGINMQNFGTLFVSVDDKDKQESFPLVKRFYDLGFNIVATAGTAKFLKELGINIRVVKRISEGSEDILTLLRSGHVAYVINTSKNRGEGVNTDGSHIRFTAYQNKIPVLTCLDTVGILLNVLEDITIGVSTIDS